MNRLWLALGGIACGAGAACASVLGIPNDTASFCSTNTGHTYCEDFDLGDPLSRMSFHTTTGGGQLSLVPSDDSPPNLLDLRSPVLGPTQLALAGYDEEFTSSGFGAMHIELDLRIVTRGQTFRGAAGFMLISDKQGGCIGIAIVPGGIGAVTEVDPYGCGTLIGSGGVNLDAGSRDGGADGGSMATIPLGGLPPLDQWVHIKAAALPSPSHDGSGTFTFDVVGQLAGYKPLTIAPGTFTPAGTPLVGFSAAGLPGSGEVEFQFDNITVDLSAP